MFIGPITQQLQDYGKMPPSSECGGDNEKKKRQFKCVEPIQQGFRA